MGGEGEQTQEVEHVELISPHSVAAAAAAAVHHQDGEHIDAAVEAYLNRGTA